MGVVVRVVAIAAVAIVGFFGLTVLGGGFDAPDANIGAGLVVFVVFVVGSFGWAAFDGWRGAVSGERRALGGLGRLVLRWAIVAALVPTLVTAVLVLVGGVAADWAWPEPVWLWLTQFMMSFLPALVGLGTGYAVRALSSAGSPTR